MVRSPKNHAESKNIDIIFVGVEFIQLPRHLNGVELDEGGESDVAAVSNLVGKPVNRVFVLNSGCQRHLIAAVACKVLETECDIFDSPFA